MSDIDVTELAKLIYLRALRDSVVAVDPASVPGFGDLGSYLLPDLEERGLVIRKDPHRVTTSAEADRLLRAIDEQGVKMLAEFESCPFTHSHTSYFCGRSFCRES